MKISVFAIFVFAILFGFLVNFGAGNLQNLVKAESENLTENSETNSAQISASENENQNFIIKTVDYIQFDGKSYIDTGVDQTGAPTIEADFEIPPRDELLFNVSEIFGARCNINETGAPTASGCPSGEPYVTQNQQSLLFVIRRLPDFPEVFPSGVAFYMHYTANLVGSTRTFADADSARHQIKIVGKNIYFDNSASPITEVAGVPNYEKIPYAATDVAKDGFPTILINIFLGGINDDGIFNKSGIEGYNGKIFGFKISKNGILLRDFVPAARFVCDSAEVEYGFIDRANNDEWYGNLGTGEFDGAPEISAEKCAENNENSAEDLKDNSDNSENDSAKIIVPNTGIFGE